MRFLNICWIFLILNIFSCNQKQKLEIEFKELRGLTDTSKVTYKGVEVGQVDEIQVVSGSKFLVYISVLKNFELPKRADFILYSRDIDGTKGIGIKENDSIEPTDYTTILKGQLEDSSTVNKFISIAKELIEITKGDINKKDSLKKELKRIEDLINVMEQEK